MTALGAAADISRYWRTGVWYVLLHQDIALWFGAVAAYLPVAGFGRTTAYVAGDYYLLHGVSAKRHRMLRRATFRAPADWPAPSCRYLHPWLYAPCLPVLPAWQGLHFLRMLYTRQRRDMRHVAYKGGLGGPEVAAASALYRLPAACFRHTFPYCHLRCCHFFSRQPRQLALAPGSWRAYRHSAPHRSTCGSAWAHSSIPREPAWAFHLRWWLEDGWA